MVDDAAEVGRELKCSFCGKPQRDVRKLIAGPTAYICDECIDRCKDAANEEREAPGRQAPKILKREWTTAEGWRDTKAGMWAWLIQRAAAIALLFVVSFHLANPFRRGVQTVLLALVLVHALLGGRSILLDFGLPVRWHRVLFGAALLLAAIIFAALWAWRWY